MLHRGEEDYIKSIYELSLEQNKKLIKTNDLAVRLSFTDQSVNEMIKKLAAKGFLKFIPYKGVSLTDKGLDEAIRLVRAHRVWEVFLVKHLGFNWDAVHDEAEILEHASSVDVINKLYKFLGSPKYCSHGNPIPDENGLTEVVFNKNILTFGEGNTFTLKRVLDNQRFLKSLIDHEVSIDKTLTIKKLTDETVSFKEIDLIISYNEAKMMFGV